MAIKLSENDLLEKLGRIAKAATRPPRAGSQLRLGIGDDAAVFRPSPGSETVLTCDWFLEGIHFLREAHPPDSIGWKCLARALSDLAAMGATPKCFLLSLAIPPSCTGPWLDGFLNGLRRASRKFHCPLAGGDTTRHERVLLNLTAVGELPAATAVLRSGARVGDYIYVSGRLGEAELGLRLLRKGQRQLSGHINPCLRKHLYPQPRLKLGQRLRERNVATSMMDLSDGLSTDLNRLCAASLVGARLEMGRIPVPHGSDDRIKASNLLNFALHGGDDYELLFTVPRKKANRLPASFEGVTLTRIGEITSGRSIQVTLPDGRKEFLLPAGWDPFRK
jgi:thiamine-monophosphate kinase